ncbi:hypothetical protein LOTGIDRAFT_232447 [Lottia gigantea]|uniref:Claudin n=1 Tax=Lottia gigantea TaxID=225164 RepID=V3ZRY0_LOTGI|nr:hypothetical protein LOTGIDRAFT_232447 [Lottia gigantea]ESO94188.1 hypothetical protein LOTGIDRAFT_232447 [Lottia gigantea]
MGFSDTSMFMKISMALGIVAFIFDLIGFASPYWLIQSGAGVTISNLLWQSCYSNDGSSECKSLQSEGLTSEIKAGQAFNVLGFLAGGVAVVLIILYIFCLTNKKPVRLLGMIAAFVAAGLILIGVIIIGTSDSAKSFVVGWAMILAIIGAILYVVTGVMVVVDVVQI